MNNYLLSVSIGPVQGFIASARRTRDLWFGSELLSEISKAVALCLQNAELKEGSTQLVFPAPECDDDLQPGSRFNVGNKILVEVTQAGAGEIRQISERAKKAAQERWFELAKKSLNEIQSRHQEFHVRDQVWENQLEDVIEYFSAWTPLTADYAASRQRVEQLLAARKNSRDFLPSAVPEAHAWKLPKSSLDGQRETVLPKALTLWQKRKMGLNEGEQLDCPGLVKRLGGQGHDSKFTPLSRIALDPWLRGIKQSDEIFKDIKQHLHSLVPDGLVTQVSGNNGCYESFPYDGQLLYPSRIAAEKKRLERERDNSDKPDEADTVIQRLDRLAEAVKEAGVYTRFNQPSPYLAVIAADGDHMGKVLNRVKDAEGHRQISEKLSQFAMSVPDIARQYRAHCIYAGGDDVLALVPLDQAIGCARALRDKFCEILGDYKDPEPTLSVGVAVVHFMEPMGRALTLARQAEGLAKGNSLEDSNQKDALAIVLDPRSGASLEYRARWDQNPDAILQTWIDAHVEDLIPDGAAYELREEARALQWAMEDENADTLITKEVKRILGRKRAEHGQRNISDELLETLNDHAAQVGMAQLANELILTRRFAEAKRQSNAVRNSRSEMTEA